MEGVKFSFDSFNGSCIWSRMGHKLLRHMLHLMFPVSHPGEFCSASKCSWLMNVEFASCHHTGT
jgi:hypothetical protein